MKTTEFDDGSALLAEAPLIYGDPGSLAERAARRMTKPRRRWPAFLAGFALGGLCASVLWFSFWRWGDEHWQALAVRAGYGHWHYDERDMPRFKWGCRER